MFKQIAKMITKNKSNPTTKLKEKMHQESSTYFYGMGKPIWSSRNYAELAEQGYMQNVIAYRAIDMVAKAAASIPIKLQKKIDGLNYTIKDHPILDLLYSPNPSEGGREFMEAIYTSRFLSGNAYILGVDKENNQGRADPGLDEIYLLRTDRVQVIAGTNYLPLGYRYQVDGTYIDYEVNETSGKSNILHLKNYHPMSDWYGLSPLEVATFSIDQHNQASAWNQALLQNGARPSGAILVKNSEGQGCRLNTDQFNRLKNMIDDIFSGPTNAGRPLLLEGGLEWKEMSMSPKDMDYIESKNNAAREIALAIGVPPQLLGIPGDNTYSNLAEARIAMWEQTVLPMVDNTLNHLGRWLGQCWNEEIALIANIDEISALSSRVEALWRRVANIDFITNAEKRQMIGLSPYPEENTFFAKNPQKNTANNENIRENLEKNPEPEKKIDLKTKSKSKIENKL